MSFCDTWEHCTKCNRRFVFTVEMQRHLAGTNIDEQEALTCPTCTPRDEAGVPKQTPQMQLDPITGNWVGSIKWFDLDKGYGFIDRGDGSDIFFHKSGIMDAAAKYVEDQAVTYAVEETDRGPQAIEVQIFEM